MEVRPVVLKNGKLELLQSGDSLTVTPNFSFKKIISGEMVIIPTNQQMILKGDITIEGDLMINGELCLF